MLKSAKTFLITRCSSGFGKILAEIATARNPDSLSDFVDRYPDTARTIALDVTQ